jgi:hypothetical protein
VNTTTSTTNTTNVNTNTSTTNTTNVNTNTSTTNKTTTNNTNVNSTTGKLLRFIEDKNIYGVNIFNQKTNVFSNANNMSEFSFETNSSEEIFTKEANFEITTKNKVAGIKNEEKLSEELLKNQAFNINNYNFDQNLRRKERLKLGYFLQTNNTKNPNGTTIPTCLIEFMDFHGCGAKILQDMLIIVGGLVLIVNSKNQTFYLF